GGSAGQVAFVSEGSFAGRVARHDDAANAAVDMVRLRPYLERDVDLLKLNIEGAETDVLVDNADLLHRVRRIVLEYHSFASEPQTLHTLLGVLSTAGYRIYVRSFAAGAAPRPFAEVPTHMGMDLHLYVYAYRESSSAGAPTP